MRVGLLEKILLLTFLLSFGVMAQTGPRPTVEERLIRLEEKVDAVEKRLEDTNKRIDDLRNDTKTEFENTRAELNNRFDDLRFWLGLIATIVLAALGGLFGMGLYIIKNMHRVESGVDGKVLQQIHVTELEEMRKRIAALEAQLKQPQVGPA